MLPPTDNIRHESSALDELLMAHLHALIEKLARPHTLEELQPDVTALDDLLQSFPDKGQILEKLLDAEATADERAELLQAMETSRAQVTRPGERASRMCEPSRGPTEPSDVLTAEGKQPSATAPESGKAGDVPKTSDVRILYVEDEADNAESLAELLRFSGYQVTVARTVADGLRLAKEESFHLILLDNWFPQEDGTVLCRKIREFNPQIPIIFYSAAGYTTDVERGLRAGAQAYIVKPDIQQLRQAIAQALADVGKP